MRARPVAAARHSLFSLPSRFLAAVLVASMSCTAAAQAPEAAPLLYSPAASSVSGYLARIGFNNPEQLSEAMDRVEAFFDEHGGDGSLAPISIVVHGPEVSVFEKNQYEMFKPIVDKAAQLSALGLLDIAVCETRLDYEGVNAQDVYPFVGKVSFGPAEINRLLNEENFVYF